MYEYELIIGILVIALYFVIDGFAPVFKAKLMNFIIPNSIHRIGFIHRGGRILQAKVYNGLNKQFKVKTELYNVGQTIGVWKGIPVSIYDENDADPKIVDYKSIPFEERESPVDWNVLIEKAKAFGKIEFNKKIEQMNTLLLISTIVAVISCVILAFVVMPDLGVVKTTTAVSSQAVHSLYGYINSTLNYTLQNYQIQNNLGQVIPVATN